MRTTPWTPASPSGYAQSDILGLDQRFAVTANGNKPAELGGVAAVYLAVSYHRANLGFVVSTLEGVEVGHNRGGKLGGDVDFLSAMNLMEQVVIMERNRAINDTVDHIAAHAGINPADLPGMTG